MKFKVQSSKFKSKLVNLKKYLPFFLLLIILLIGGFLRFYRIKEYMTFLGDEGRDALVVKRIIIDHKFTLLGPITSVGSMYMGPIYYYFMVPFLWLWHFDPVGPSIMVALFAELTIALIFLLGTEFFSPIAGLIAAFLYAVSPLTVNYGRSSWNPNIVPFFSLLIIYSLLKLIVKRQHQWFLVIGLALGVLLQLHYVTLMFIPIIFVCLIFYRPHLKLNQYFGGTIAFFTSYSPFLLFELRHQFVNTRAAWHFVTTQKSGQPFNLFTIFATISDVVVRLFWRLVVVTNAEFTKLFLLGLVMTLYIYFRNSKRNLKNRLSLNILLLWLIIGIISFGLYSGIIYDYYFGGLFAAPFILTAIALTFLWQKSYFGKLVTLLTVFLLTFFSLQKSHLWMPPSNLLNNTEKIARFIYDKTEGQPYNFALIANKNSDHAYRYFLEIWGHQPVIIENPVNDPERKTVTSQLLIVCEEKVCQPLGHPLWEIAGFGQAEITGEWKVVTTTILRLVHYQKT